jgi:hypothetical protein
VVELAERAVEAAWKITNLEDYDRRLERAARRVDEISHEHETAALVIYEAALMKSGKSLDEVRELVRTFQKTWEDEEDPLTIPRVSGIMNVEGTQWFFGDESLRVLTGRLLGQFQHRVAQYNYVSEREVLKRWADSYDTRLFIRRRIYETEPVVGVVGGLDLQLVQFLRVSAGGDTLVPSEGVARALRTLGFEVGDEYDVLARAENLAIYLDLPAPVAGEMLEDLAREDFTDFPEPPRNLNESEQPEEVAGDAPSEEGSSQRPRTEDRATRRAAREDAGKGEEPTRVQDPQAKDTPGIAQENPGAMKPVAPESGQDDAPGTSASSNDEEPGEKA